MTGKYKENWLQKHKTVSHMRLYKTVKQCMSHLQIFMQTESNSKLKENTTTKYRIAKMVQY